MQYRLAWLVATCTLCKLNHVQVFICVAYITAELIQNLGKSEFATSYYLEQGFSTGGARGPCELARPCEIVLARLPSLPTQKIAPLQMV